MKITKKSILTGVERTRDMPEVTEEKYEQWRGTDGNPGKPIQDVFPELSADDREFLMTGITPDEWDQFMDSKR
jgi:hypothetical protein